VRLLLFVLLALAFSLGGYVALQQHPLQHDAVSVSPPTTRATPVPRSHLSHYRLPVAKSTPRRTPPFVAPAQAGNPPRDLRRRLAHSLPILYLPRVLPARTLSIPIMMYHHVSSLAPATELNAGLTVTDSDFAAQLAYLRQHAYHTILLRQVFAALYHHAPLPAHPIVLTFDDGYLDNYTDALPSLQRYHDRGEFNIITAYPGLTVGVNSYMTWPQIKALVHAGMEIGSHTVDHQDLGVLSLDKLRFELRDSRNVLQRSLGIPVQFLAYPSGEPFVHGSSEAQQRVVALLPAYGYVGAVLDGPLITTRQDAQAPFQLQRIRVSGGEGIAAFAASLQN